MKNKISWTRKDYVEKEMIRFIKDQKVNLALVLMSLSLSIFIEVGDKFLQYAIIIKLTVIFLLFTLCKCVYYLLSYKKGA